MHPVVQPTLLAILSSITLIALGKYGDDWLKRRDAKRAATTGASKEARESEAEEINAARFWKDDALELRKQIAQLRLEVTNERAEFKKQIDKLQATNQRQEQQILSLKGQIFDLQRDRQRQTTEGDRQTREGERQTREGERQTVEGERLHNLRQDMDATTEGDSR